MPVIVHPLTGDQINWKLLQTRDDDALKRFVVRLPEEDWVASIVSIKCMIDAARFIGWRLSGQPATFMEAQQMGRPPLCRPHDYDTRICRRQKSESQA